MLATATIEAPTFAYRYRSEFPVTSGIEDTLYKGDLATIPERMRAAYQELGIQHGDPTILVGAGRNRLALGHSPKRVEGYLRRARQGPDAPPARSPRSLHEFGASEYLARLPDMEINDFGLYELPEDPTSLRLTDMLL